MFSGPISIPAKSESLGREPDVGLFEELSGDVEMLPGLTTTKLPLSRQCYSYFLGEPYLYLLFRIPFSLAFFLDFSFVN